MSTAQQAQEELIESCQDLVRSLAWKLRSGLPRNVDIEDLIGYGQVGVSEAAKAFDPSKGVKFSTFAYYRVRGAIYDGLTLMSWFRKSPYQQLKFQQAANDILESEADESTKWKSNSVAEDATWFNQITGMLAIASLASRNDESERDIESQIVDNSVDSPDTVVSDDEVKCKVRQVLDELPGQEGTLMRAAYYEGLSLKQAAQRIGISKAWASRLHARTLKRLASTLRELGVSQ